MRINDLDYLEIELEKIIAGALYVDAHAQTLAQFGFGYADAQAVAYGSHTVTITQAYVKVQNTAYTTMTDAAAKAKAHAEVPHGYHQSVHESKSWSLNAVVVR